MDLRALLTDERAVSPVIAVILMVAITVVLAAVIGTTVLGVGEEVEPAPQASFGFAFNETNQSVDVNHRGGDRIEVGENAERVGLTSTGGTGETWIDSSGESISAGDTYDGFDYGAPDATVRVVWEGEKNDSSATLAQEEAPA